MVPSHLIINFFRYIDRKFLFNQLRNLYNLYTYIKSIFYLKNFQDYSKSLYNFTNQLDNLCDKYGSDKGFNDLRSRTLYLNRNPHNYTNVYNALLNHCKNDIKLVLECGIGTNNPEIQSTMGSKYKPGASLFVWRDYFQNAEIFGCDVDRKILFNDNRIKTNYVDQLDKHSIELMFSKINRDNFDLIIDDGLHAYQAAINFFDIAFKYLKPGGLYIIEDVGWSYILKLLNYLKNYQLEVVHFNTKRLKLLKDSNLIIVRKELV